MEEEKQEEIKQEEPTEKTGKRNIFESITAMMKEIPAIGKDQRNQQQGFKYRGVDDVMNALSPLLAKYKIFIVPKVKTQERYDGTTKNGGKMFKAVCTIDYEFYAEDGSSITATLVGEGMDTGDKATNKAMAIAYKYALFQVFCIPTKEMIDPDKETPEPTEELTKELPQTTTNTNDFYTKKTTISEAQQKRLFAISKGNSELVRNICAKYGYEHSKDISYKDYDNICTEVQNAIGG